MKNKHFNQLSVVKHTRITASGYTILVLLFSMMMLKATTGDAQPVITFETSMDANSGFPITVDIIQVTDEALISSLSALSASEWFTRKSQFQAIYNSDIHITSHQLVSGQKVSDVMLPQLNTPAILMFAHYHNPNGQSVADLSYYDNLRIKFFSTYYELIEEGN